MKPVILIPCKDLDRGKSRLAVCLTPRSRRALCEFFLCRTLDVATATVSPAYVRVVTSDPRVRAIAREYGVAVIADREGDLNGALECGRRRILADVGDCAGLVLPIDLPLATPAALGEIADAPQDVVIVPDEEMEGTNVLRLGPRALRRFPFSFGPHSYAAHCAAAQAAGFEVRTVNAPGLAFDVDGPEQYRRWAPENPAWAAT
jgi:2-phospho-L-lactate/phosphoenolpyruvate guanylyltransferase